MLVTTRGQIQQLKRCWMYALSAYLNRSRIYQRKNVLPFLLAGNSCSPTKGFNLQLWGTIFYIVQKKCGLTSLGIIYCTGSFFLPSYAGARLLILTYIMIYIVANCHIFQIPKQLCILKYQKHLIIQQFSHYVYRKQFLY